MTGPERSRSSLARLSRLKAEFAPGSGAEKLDLLRALDSIPLAGSKSVLMLHEILCFLSAYPDDARLLRQVESMLKRFAARPDIERFRSRLDNSGVAGTDLYDTFFSRTAQWLASRFPERLTVAWDHLPEPDILERRLNLLATYSESPGLDELDLGVRAWIARLKGRNETDAVFILRRFATLRVEPAVRDQLYDEMRLMLKLAWGRGGFSRTTEKLPGFPVHFQTRPLRRERPDLRAAATEPPRAVRNVSPAEGERLVIAAREAMIARNRDLDVFIHGDPRDVRLIHFEEGLSFVAIGFKPEARLLLESVYGFLTLKNGVPIGYVLVGALNRSVEIAYNVFDTWRGNEAAVIYGRVLAMTAHLFGARSFTVPPYQLGHDNEEGLDSGAWWFYQKLGFRARNRNVLHLMNRELARMKRNPDHRSSRATLQKLSGTNAFLELDRPRADVMGVLPLYKVGLAITDSLAARFGADRERGLAVCTREARQILGAGDLQGWSRHEKTAFERWAPLVLLVRDLDRWAPADRRALVAVIRAKGGRRESDYVQAFDGHARLRQALMELIRPVKP
jgi:hypothetical protein